MSLLHWRRWLGPANRCVVPFTPFSEDETGPGGKKSPVWFALGDYQPLACFAYFDAAGGYEAICGESALEIGSLYAGPESGEGSNRAVLNHAARFQVVENPRLDRVGKGVSIQRRRYVGGEGWEFSTKLTR